MITESTGHDYLRDITIQYQVDYVDFPDEPSHHAISVIALRLEGDVLDEPIRQYAYWTADQHIKHLCDNDKLPREGAASFSIPSSHLDGLVVETRAINANNETVWRNHEVTPDAEA